MFFFFFLNGERSSKYSFLVKAKSQSVEIQPSYTLSQKKLTWVLSTTTQILQELAIEPLSHNKRSTTKKRGLIRAYKP
jgi:hypothetical protein